MSAAVKGLPASVDAERAVLGAVILDNAAYNAAAETLVADDFSHQAHRTIFACMVTLAETGRPIDPITLTEELIRTNKLEEIGGVMYLSSLSDGLPRSVNAEHYARIVKEKALLRRLIHTSNQIMVQALEGGEDVSELIGRAESAILSVGEDRGRDGLLQLAEIYRRAYKSLDDLLSRGRRITGVATGFRRLDELTCGFQRADLILIAARPSMGKTALALSIAAHVAVHEQQPVAIFSLEMSREALLTRLLCAEARVDSHKFRSGFLNKEDLEKLSRAMARLIEAPLFIDDTPSLRLQELHAKSRRLKRERGLALVELDYIQLLNPPKAENRNQEVASISRGLKMLAKELDVPVVALSQLSRAPETRGGAEAHKPQLSDLRDSGALEQDADLVAFIYRQEYYDRQLGREVDPEVEGRASLIVAKQRNGPVDSVQLAFLDRFARFDNIAEGF